MTADRDLAAEQDHAEFTGWMEAQGYNPDPDMVCGGGEMRDAFAAGMRAARDLAAARQPAELAAAMAETRELRKLAAEIIAVFLPSGSGHTARTGQVQIRKWRERAGLES